MRTDGYADLREYAAIGDGRTVALIARDGQIDWLPMPALHTPPVFAGIVDAPLGGHFALRPRGEFTSSRAYVDGTNVLVTRFETSTGTAIVTDALITGVAGRLPWSELARRIDGIEGEVVFEWAVVPGNVFGTDPVRRLNSLYGPILRAGEINLALVGFAHGRLDPHAPGRGVVDEPLDFHGEFATAPGSRHLLCLCGTDDEPIHLPDPHVVDEGVDRTIASWQSWSKEFNWDGPWGDVVQRSALALKLLIFSPTGAIAAAATTSLPERITDRKRTAKNYDYRFAWVRDLAYTVDALISFGLREEPHAAVSWVLKALKGSGGSMRIFFELDGSLSDGVHEMTAEGYRGVGPVLVGNVASGQLQLGVYADVLAIMSTYVDGGNILDESTSELLLGFADDACIMWQKKDSGMWELPKARHYTSSKMGCWQAIVSALKLADAGEIHPSESQRATWERNRDLIREWVDANAWSEELGSYVMYPGSTDVDASVLLHAPSGFDRGERMSRTIDRLYADLGAGPLLYRYSGMREEEGTFTACAFWAASALACVGRHDEAVALMEQLVAQVNDVGLLTEMIDAESGDFLGNFPQGLSHLAVVNAAILIDALADV
ncbi:glycoside hydrolase family 15 protein [Naasia lichenicola]|uniref:glycoside hydrolase family 15 protein n=1 Tax=Naasia lichenicola TaxID=2565933 RepID=UPI001E62CAFA|nr:glycoside hydrolase family 15 protein [Naasia lichenicola]